VSLLPVKSGLFSFPPNIKNTQLDRIK